MNKDLTGSIVLVKGESWISKQIILHMKLYAKLKHYKPLPFSHGETLLWNEVERNLTTTETTYRLKAKTMYTIGARESGVEISEADTYYQGKTYLVLKPIIPLTVGEIQSQWTFFQYMDKSKYQYSNLLSWLQKIKTFSLIWIGRRGAETVYCFELAARFADMVHRWPMKSLDIVSSYDLFQNNNYKEM